MLVRLFSLLLAVSTVLALPGSITCIANVRGKKYEIAAETVGEFSQKVESLSGLTANEQSVLFRGKVLDAKESLESIGVASGDVLNVLKGRKVKAPKPAGFALDEPKTQPAAKRPKSLSREDMLSMDPEKVKEMMKDIDPKQLQESMLAVEDMMTSMFADEQKLEQARLQMLEKADELEKMMPGMKQQLLAIASDPVEWKKAMGAAQADLQQARARRNQGQGQGQGQQGQAMPKKPDTGLDEADEEDEP